MVASSPNSFGRTQCRQCGGTTRGVTGRQYLQCEYCSSLVFPHDNPLNTDEIVPMGDELDCGCPNCGTPLQTGEMDGNPALYCGTCYGILVRNDVFGRVIRDRRAKRSHKDTIDVKPIDMAQYERIPDCPSCHGKMEVHPYFGPGNVVIDSCHRCNYVWLDHGELSTMELAGGGTEPPMVAPGQIERDMAAAQTSAFFGHRHHGDSDLPIVTLLDLLF